MAIHFDDDAGRDRRARRSREKQDAVADIGPMPDVVDPARKAACELDLYLYLTTYFPGSTGLSPFSTDHKRAIARMQGVILGGGRQCNSVFRGWAKTSITQGAAMWAESYGHRRYTAVFSANEPQADDLIAGIKMELSENDLLYEDFPEICHAVRALEGKPQRCHSQTYKGELTHIAWRADRIQFPTIPGSKASGCLIASRGMTGSGTRGLLHKMPDGTNQRPDFAVVDDPQTNDSAATPLQVTKRLDIIKRSILKLGGHNRQIACVVNGTPIEPDDVIEQLLDPVRSPSWQGERIKMVLKWSDAHDTLWLGDYAKLRTTFDRGDPEDQKRAWAEASAFYVANRAAMDAGSLVSWEYCYGEGEVSAIQHAYNMLIDDGPDIFATECQCETQHRSEIPADALKPEQVLSQLNGYSRYEVPADCQHGAAMIDIGQNLIEWAVAFFASDFTGYVVDYGVSPEQPSPYVSSDHARYTLPVKYPGADLAGQLQQALEELTNGPNGILRREWMRDDGTPLKVGRCMIDANWAESTAAVKAFCRQSQHAAILIPSHGQGVSENKRRIEEYENRDGWLATGQPWAMPPAKKGSVRHVIFDTNFYKTFLHERFRLPLGNRGGMTLWGGKFDHEKRAAAVHHRMLAEHVTAEIPERRVGTRTIDKWTLLPGRENHLLDCLVGCCVGASMLGARVKGASVDKPASKPRMSLADMAKAARGK